MYMKNKLSSFDYEKHFMGHSESESDIEDCTGHYRFKRLSEAVRLGKQRVLDYGCGGGVFLRSLKTTYPSIFGYGCDVSLQAITLAKKADSLGNIYKKSPVSSIPFESSFFDVLSCMDVLEHIDNYTDNLKEMKRVLKKDGKIFFCIPCEGQPYTYTWLFRLFYKKFDLTNRYWGHVHPEFTHKYVVDIMKKNGFRVVNIWYGEHIFSQCFELCTYFLPKLLLEKFMGNKIASRVTDSGVTKRKLYKKSFAEKALLRVRSLWFAMTKTAGNIALYESDVLKNVSFGAWKILILVEKV